MIPVQDPRLYQDPSKQRPIGYQQQNMRQNPSAHQVQTPMMQNPMMHTPAMKAGPMVSGNIDQKSQQTVQAKQPASGKQPVVQVRTVFMDEKMQAKAIELAKEACMNDKISTSPREIAGHLKLAFDELYGPTWHCIVGRSYGSFVTHERDSFIFFYVDQWAVMLFKTA